MAEKKSDKILELPESPIDFLQSSIQSIMYNMKESYSQSTEYKTIMMNLTTISKELNAMRVKEITGEVEIVDNK